MATRDVTERGVGERYDTAPTHGGIVRVFDETKAAIKSTVTRGLAKAGSAQRDQDDSRRNSD